MAKAGVWLRKSKKLTIGMQKFLAETILTVHAIVILFNVAGLFLIPAGAWLGWRIVRVAWLRILHLVLIAVVAGQALAGRACFLTLWQQDLANNHGPPVPLIMYWVDRLIYWNLPFRFFQILYSVTFLYIVAITVLVPFWRQPGKGRSHVD